MEPFVIVKFKYALHKLQLIMTQLHSREPSYVIQQKIAFSGKQEGVFMQNTFNMILLLVWYNVLFH